MPVQGSHGLSLRQPTTTPVLASTLAPSHRSIGTARTKLHGVTLRPACWITRGRRLAFRSAVQESPRD
jgi:hypothetical protein